MVAVKVRQRVAFYKEGMLVVLGSWSQIAAVWNRIYYDITVVDMGDLPESEVSIPELSHLTRKWPPAVIAHMRWRQPELEEMQQAAKLQYRKKQPAQCDFCSRTIRCDMYRHVARCHFDLAQLWRCPVAWCTVWKGALQDLTDHVRYAHRVPEEVQSVRLDKLIPPWTVTRKVYTESLTSRHSGISNDILLFSDIGLSLAHHYRVHKKGVPHVAFRKNYMSQLRTMPPLPAAQFAQRGSPEPGCSEMVGSYHRPSRRTFTRRRIPRVRETPTRIAPRLTELDPLAAAGAMVFDCRPQVLPGAMDVSGLELTEICSTTRASAATSPPPEREQSFGGGGGTYWDRYDQSLV